MDRALDVGIVGCGFAGAATALLLARAGHAVTIYERVPEPGAVGAGILLQPTGLAVLARLGLLEAMVARGARIEGLHCTTTAGRTLFDLRYADLAPDLFGLGTHRGALFELLFAAVRSAGVTVRCDHQVDALDPLCAAHDLVVVADGARSRLRARSADHARSRPYRFGALWFVGADPERRFGATLSQVCDGSARMLGFLPTGRGPGSSEVPLVSLFWSLRTDAVDDWRRSGLTAWKEAVLGFAPHAGPLLDQIADTDQLLTATYVDGVMRRWHQPDPCVAYVGDAAHAMSPQLGQGTNFALLDAAILADCLEAAPDVPAALAAYSRHRRAPVRFYQLASRWLTPLFQSDGRWLAGVRDALLPLLGRIGPVRTQMLRTLAGVKRGIVRRSLPLAPVRAALALPAQSLREVDNGNSVPQDR